MSKEIPYFMKIIVKLIIFYEFFFLRCCCCTSWLQNMFMGFEAWLDIAESRIAHTHSLSLYAQMTFIYDDSTARIAIHRSHLDQCAVRLRQCCCLMPFGQWLGRVLIIIFILRATISKEETKNTLIYGNSHVQLRFFLFFFTRKPFASHSRPESWIKKLAMKISDLVAKAFTLLLR